MLLTWGGVADKCKHSKGHILCNFSILKGALLGPYLHFTFLLKVPEQRPVASINILIREQCRHNPLRSAFGWNGGAECSWRKICRVFKVQFEWHCLTHLEIRVISYLFNFRHATPGTSFIYIIDTRPAMNAMANKVKKMLYSVVFCFNFLYPYFILFFEGKWKRLGNKELRKHRLLF